LFQIESINIWQRLSLGVATARSALIRPFSGSCLQFQVAKIAMINLPNIPEATSQILQRRPCGQISTLLVQGHIIGHTVRLRCIFIGFLLLMGSSFAAPKAHTVFLGQWRSVEVRTEAGEKQPLRVRELVIDGRIREFTTGPTHEVTDRMFVVRRAYRINDALPEEKKPQQWVWRLDGWISVDRQTGHVAQLNLPAFDGEASEASWYRDYAAYCGASDDGAKTYMVVAQLGKRKPVLRKEFPGPACAAPTWERSPSRVTFTAAGEKTSFVVHAHSADLQPETAEEEGPQQ
jgi:hypothetical protein